MLVFENRTAAYVRYARIGRAEDRHLQASISECRLVLGLFVLNAADNIGHVVAILFLVLDEDVIRLVIGDLDDIVVVAFDRTLAAGGFFIGFFEADQLGALGDLVLDLFFFFVLHVRRTGLVRPGLEERPGIRNARKGRDDWIFVQVVELLARLRVDPLSAEFRFRHVVPHRLKEPVSHNE